MLSVPGNRVFVLDSVLRAIDSCLSYPPEMGGALIGPPGKLFVTHFLFDDAATVTDVTYIPSSNLAERVQDIERREHLEFKGIVHSHPGRLARPSSSDRWEAGEGLEINPHLASYLVPIVTRVPSKRRFGRHEMPMAGGRISFFVRYQGEKWSARVHQIEVREVPMLQDLGRVHTVFGGIEPPETFVTEVGGVPLPAGRIHLDGLELVFIVGELYPFTAPILLVTNECGTTNQVNLPWPLESPPDQRLVDALRTVIFPPGPYQVWYGPPRGPAFTQNAASAELAGWSRLYAGVDPKTTTDVVREGIFARGTGLLSETPSQKTVLVVGVGSVGSYMADQMIRSGVGGAILLDPDHVEAVNLSRTVYEAPCLGKKKALALARHLLRINPAVDVEARAISIWDLEPKDLQRMVERADLVIAATDDPRAQLTLNRFAYGCGTPAVFVGLYAGAQGGEVVVTVPEQTACYLCATSIRHSLLTDSPVRPDGKMDYGTGRLTGEIALGVDIQHVAGAAVKMGLSLLVSQDSTATLGGFLDKPITAGLTYVTFSTVADYWFYPSIFQGVPGQNAYQSVWLVPTRQSECPVCGSAEFRLHPLDVPLRTPDFNRTQRTDVHRLQPAAGDEPLPSRHQQKVQ